MRAAYTIFLSLPKINNCSLKTRIKVKEISPMVKITLPNPNDYQYEGGIKHFLRQLELCVHHAQKSYDEIVKERKENGWNEYNETEFVVFRQPRMDFYDISEIDGSDKEGNIKIHVDTQSDDGQEIVLEINEA